MAFEVFEQGEEDVSAPPRVAEEPIRPACPGCGYDLAGTLEREPRRCPECGREWTLDELALQHLARRDRTAASIRMAAVIGPGLAIGLLLWLGLVFGPPITWLAWPAAGVATAFFIAEWAGDAYRLSFARARSRANRILYIASRTALLVAANAIIVGGGGFVLLIAVTSCARAGAG